MSVSESYRDYVLEQLGCMGQVTAKNMFGGVGLYLDGLFFALIANDTLYFKVDGTNRPDYEAAGMGPFRPYGDKSYAMKYYEVPVEVLEDRETLRLWANKALAVARRKLSVSKKQDTFNGFSPKALDFLRDLKANNDKAWFERHRQDYQEYLLEPLQNLVVDMGKFMLTIDPYFETRPAINKTISRIYRDTRFSKDKSPYKSTMWITFKRPDKDWKDAPAYFFEISPDSYRYGMGFYSASPDTMYRFREMIDKNPKEFLKAISFYSRQQIFVIEGEIYKRIFDENKPEEIKNWYQRRNLYLVCNKRIDDRLFRREVIDDLTFGFGLVAPFYHHLWKIKF
jgi:uncharacterized protein (TIGR02453 family)